MLDGVLTAMMYLGAFVIIGGLSGSVMLGALGAMVVALLVYLMFKAMRRYQ